ESASVTDIRQRVRYATIKDSYWNVLQDASVRAQVLSALNNRWFPKMLKTSYEELRQHLTEAGLFFHDELLSNYLLALQTKRFVVLTGISGTGKTRLAMAVASHLGRATITTVQPDWTDHRGLLGYLNPIDREYAMTPFLAFLLEAAREEQRAIADQR